MSYQRGVQRTCDHRGPVGGHCPAAGCHPSCIGSDLAALEGSLKPGGPTRIRARFQADSFGRMTPTHRVACPRDLSDCREPGGGWAQRTREVIEIPTVIVDGCLRGPDARSASGVGCPWSLDGVVMGPALGGRSPDAARRGTTTPTPTNGICGRISCT